MAAAATLENPTRPEVVFSGQTVVDTSICRITVEQEVGHRKFVYAVYAILAVLPETAVGGQFSCA